MGRRKKGRDISGWVLVDKPAGPGSTDVVNKVRRAFDAKKAGHAGTLDPDATGLLAVALGEATKTIPHITDAEKGYVFTVRWGVRTATDDAAGEVIETSDVRPSDAAILAALAAFTGDILQVPPAFSAVKVDGERAYDMARRGEGAELAARPLHVARLEMTHRPDADHAVFEMDCGKGGYVRSIARDLGEALGCHGHVTELRRVWSGPFEIEDCLTLDAILADPEAALHPIEIGLIDLPQVKLSETGALRVQNGNPGEVLHSDAEFGETCWASRMGQPVGIGQYIGGLFHPSRVFNL